MRTREERRNLRDKKIKKRKEILKNGGFQGGSLYDKHVNKIEQNGLGYMSKHGTLLHFARGTDKCSQKVRDRNSYNGTENWSWKDLKQINSMNDDLKDN